MYPNSFFHVLNPNYSIDWDDVLPGLAADSHQHFLREANGAYGQPKPDPDHPFEGDPEGLMTIQVFVDPWCLGRTPAGTGGIGFQGLVRPQDLRTFLSELESERQAMFSVLDDGV